jgi:putative mRNA 3-end processing factor
MYMVLTLNNGICVDNSFRIDPEFLEGTCFVSHGHSDHLPRLGNGKVLCSDETFEVMNIRRGKAKRVDSFSNAELLDAGHVIGSNMLLYKDILYTGDFCTRDRFFLKGAKAVNAKTLIIESTFGDPHYKFPQINEIVRNVKQWVSENPKTIWFGYPFGKSQTLTALANKLGIVPYVAGNVAEYNKLVPSLKYEILSDSVLKKDEFVIVAPTYLKKAFPSEVMGAMGISSAYFSGWAMSWNQLGVDKCFPLSDHCGFDELVDFVKNVDPENILIVHGEGEELASHLREQGFDARPFV